MGMSKASIAPAIGCLMLFAITHAQALELHGNARIDAGNTLVDDLETDVLPAATTIDAYAQLPLGKEMAIVLRGENLTDETIVTRNQGGSIDLGTPLTVWVGVKVGLSPGAF